MTLSRINALRDLDYAQLANLAMQRSEIDRRAVLKREFSAHALRLMLIDCIVDEELREQRMDEAEGQGRR